jgi:GT2 family glycosyltransferase
MKFEHKYPECKSTDRFEFEYSFVTKTPKLGSCRWCNSMTKWLDVLFQVHVCSEECNAVMWKKYREDQQTKGTYDNFEEHFQNIKDELKLATLIEDQWKDIIIVVRDQLDYFKACIDSIKQTTNKYHLYIWDNASGPETSEYINSLLQSYDSERDLDWKITTVRSETNTGFIHPNNEMAALGESPYIILLNSDTKVFENWDKTMMGFMKKHEDVAQVGYWGGHLSDDGRGFGGSNGFDIDYVPGWCFCIKRETYDEFKLFSDKLRFAYCEDSDFSLRLKEAGKRIYALHTPLVHHYQNKTVVAVEKEGSLDLRATFDYNHKYIKERWKYYLANERVMLKRKAKDEPLSNHE